MTNRSRTARPAIEAIALLHVTVLISFPISSWYLRLADRDRRPRLIFCTSTRMPPAADVAKFSQSCDPANLNGRVTISPPS